MKEFNFVKKGEGMYVSKDIGDHYPEMYLDVMEDENEDIRLIVILRFEDRIIQWFVNPSNLNKEPKKKTDKTPFEIFDTDTEKEWTRRYSAVFVSGEDSMLGETEGQA